MKVFNYCGLLWAGLVATTTDAAKQCLTETPKTVYESETMSPQNMDFDRENNMFVAHPGWYNDVLIHYYKFRIFAPGTYEGVISGTSTAADVPLANLYLVTTTGGFDGVLEKPIIEYHHVDGLLYSDFMDVHFVQAPANYMESDFTSVQDIIDSGAEVTRAEILINMPVVPTGSTLQHPKAMDTMKRAPIEPVTVWYNCVPVQTFVFEVTDQAAADYFQYTRMTVASETTAMARASQDKGFEIAVTPNMGSAAAANPQVNSIPIWHVNQFRHGVVPGTGGGPDPNGMRNVINLDRPDAGYSPLWQVFWATELPLDYSANEASNNIAMSSANGFEFFIAPMFVNCPNIGFVDPSMLNQDKMDMFQTAIDLDNDKVFIAGSHKSLVFQADKTIRFMANGETEVDTTQTNAMGAYEHKLMLADIPAGTTEIQVMFEEEVIRTIPVVSSSGSTSTLTATSSGSSHALHTIVLVGMGLLLQVAALL